VVVTVFFNAGDQVPVMPFVEVVGNAAKVPPGHIGATAAKVGVTFGFTVIVIVVVVAQSPAVGVKVYVVVAVFFNAGDQVPVMPLVEVVGNAAKVVPEHIGATAVNVGVTLGFTVIVIVAVFAQSPAVGVKVYKVVAVLFIAGDHVPVIALVEVVGNAAKVAPEQIDATAVNVGVTFAFTVMVIVAVFAQSPAVGVKVYKVVAVLFIAGDHVPVIPLFEVVGNAAKVAPEQIVATAVNVGVTFAFTVMVIVVVFAQNVPVGVKVYVVVAVFFNAGDQVPVIPLVEVVGSAAKVVPEHIGVTAVNVGVTLGNTVIVKLAVVAHCPTVGVKV
jgi:hypothetical protein